MSITCSLQQDWSRRWRNKLVCSMLDIECSINCEQTVKGAVGPIYRWHIDTVGPIYCRHIDTVGPIYCWHIDTVRPIYCWHKDTVEFERIERAAEDWRLSETLHDDQYVQYKQAVTANFFKSRFQQQQF